MQLQKQERDRLLSLADSELARLCRVDCFRGSGRGGQKRNTTDSAVRVSLPELELAAASDRTRSQNTNKKLALRRLRREIAIACRAEPPERWTGSWDLSPRNPAYPQLAAVLLDALCACGYRVSEAAAFFGVSTAQLVRCLSRDKQLWGHVNACRKRLELPPLR